MICGGNKLKVIELKYRYIFGLVLILHFCFWQNGVSAIVIANIPGGEWDDNSTWVDNAPPNFGDLVIIPSGSKVTLTNRHKYFAGNISVSGTLALIYDEGAVYGNTRLLMDKTSNINITFGGEIQSFSNAPDLNYNYIKFGEGAFLAINDRHCISTPANLSVQNTLSEIIPIPEIPEKKSTETNKTVLSEPVTDSLFIKENEKPAPAILDVPVSEKSLVFPNPADDHIEINVKGNYTAVLRNIKGQKMPLNLLSLDNKFIAPTDHFPPGIYFIEILQGSSISTERIVITH